MKITTLITAKPAARAEILGIGCLEDGKHLHPNCRLDGALKSTFEKLLTARKFSGKAGESYLLQTPDFSRAKQVLFLGLGKMDSLTLQKVRLATAKILSQGKALHMDSVSMDLDSFCDVSSVDEIVRAAVEGARLSDYQFAKYKSKPGPKTEMRLELLSTDIGSARSIRAAANEAEIVCDGVYFMRDLANEPPNIMTPAALAKAARVMAAQNGLNCQILGPAQMKKLGMGGVLGVSQGSNVPAQFIILQNRVKSSKNPIVIVGKGVTFDTGGISIKPASDMDKMKFDMSGAAAVIATMMVVSRLRLPIKVIGLAPAVENMPGSSAQRPGDIIRCLNGKTVEVLNTDAEGRLILADALAYAQRFKPRALVDIATLTGACPAAFSDICSGLMSTDADLAARIKAAGDQSGERVWELPLWDEYFDLIKATYADIQNISKKMAGTITAGMFLKEFASPTTAWAHLDIAGTAWNEGAAKPLSPIGSTGMGVRLMTRLIQGYCKK